MKYDIIVQFVLTSLLTTSCILKGVSQETFPVNGVHEVFNPPTAIIHSKIFKTFNDTINDGVMLIENGRIKAIGKGIIVPDNYRVIDARGLWIYPSFIDLYSTYGIPELKADQAKQRRQQFESGKTGAYYWNQAIHPEIDAYSLFSVDEKKSNELLRMGFGVVLTHQQDGIIRGTGTLVTLSGEKEHLSILAPRASSHFSFNKGVSTQNYPSSLMGSIALFRQTMNDAKWYANPTQKEINFSLQALNDQLTLPWIFEASDYHNMLRADRMGDEFNRQFIIKGNGDEYKQLDAIKKTGASVIIPLQFPEAMEIKTATDLMNVRLLDMRHWEMAGANAFLLNRKQIRFAFTFAGLKNEAAFKKGIDKVLTSGLFESQVLKALTSDPALMIGQEKNIGSLQTGCWANFFMTDGNYFEDGTTITSHWLKGKVNHFYDVSLPDARGKYELTNNLNDSLVFEISGKRAELTVKLKWPEESGKKTVTVGSYPYHLMTNSIALEWKLNGDNVEAFSIGTNGRMIIWRGIRSPLKTEIKEREVKLIPDSFRYNLPYQYDQKGSLTYLIKDAAVWTSEMEGVLRGWDILVSGGKITQIKEEISSLPGWVVIDGNDKHLTPGIIDEHSHIAINAGVNESTQAVTSEVRIADVINHEDINIYRQLAGGVTTSHLLHGSANPIGGQTSLIKLRYGLTAEELKFGNDHRFIKFALGENVKQSNWGDNTTTRYPQTRMGVEQIIKDAFTRAKEYRKTIGTPNFRRDLELDALLEILDGKRFITCHSYQQGEINMLIHLADSMGFKVNTFTHVLEGYKVADKIKKHGAAASSFSDWWGYKFEVNDAIPYNASLLNQMGIVTAINSDDAEMGRRLNQEAAKSIKYGGMSETDALKLVTLNPAKILHIDNQTGSIKVGKDADLVLWSANPLSVYSRVLYTWVDGRIYYDETLDMAERLVIQKEKERLWKAMFEAAAKGAPTKKPAPFKEELYHCEDEIEF
jgi:imidazolonepropionase-like amidohydrolase